jgi:hypothetical protein
MGGMERGQRWVYVFNFALYGDVGVRRVYDVGANVCSCVVLGENRVF